MNKKLLAALSAAGTIGLAVSMAARADILNSKHDLRVQEETDVCKYCHTPHNASTDEALTGVVLWNRQTPTGPYQMYDSSVSSSLDGAVATTPEGVSLACLSCHDGTLAFNAVLNGPVLNTGRISAGPGLIGTDLRNDHPISIQYGVDTALNPITDTVKGLVGELRLYSGVAYTNDFQVECASCHDPHNTDNPKFLRLASVADVCTTCHIK